MSKFTEKLKAFGTKTKSFVKGKPKLIGTILALVVVATGGNATGLIETAAILDAAIQVVAPK